MERAAAFALAAAVSVFVFSPLTPEPAWRLPLSLAALAPLVWAVLRLRPRDVILVAALLGMGAAWGALADAARAAESAWLPSLVLVAMAAPCLAFSIARPLGDDGLQSTEQQYRLMVQSVHDYALYMLDPTGHVVSWNAGAARIKQYSADDIIGRHFSRFYTPEDRARGVPAMALGFAKTEGKYEAEGWRLRKDGTKFWASVVIDPVRDKSGRLIGFAKITRDITERKRVQEALEHTREQLAQAQKMEAIGQLTGGIAHDFNNLLMIVNGYAQTLRRGVSEPRLVRAVEAIQSAAARGATLTRQLLTFSRRQALNPIVTDLHMQVAMVRDMLNRTLPGNITLAIDIPEDIGRSRIDIGEFELALVNLVVNARDAMPNGGTITIAARHHDPHDSGSAALRGDFVALSVRDTGEGIPAAIQSRVFEPFFTTKATGKGTGLGLSQVYGFAHQAGGTVMIESEPGQGTTVTLFLPRSHAPATVQPALQPGEASPLCALVLLVEDNAEVATVTSAMLEQTGCRVVHAASPAAALACLRSTAFDLVLSDIVMPGGMDGIALAQTICDSHPDLPILLVSGYSEAVNSATLPFSLLRKPFDAAQLNRAVRDAMRTRGPQARPRLAAAGSG